MDRTLHVLVGGADAKNGESRCRVRNTCCATKPNVCTCVPGRVLSGFIGMLLARCGCIRSYDVVHSDPQLFWLIKMWLHGFMQSPQLRKNTNGELAVLGMVAEGGQGANAASASGCNPELYCQHCWAYTWTPPDTPLRFCSCCGFDYVLSVPHSPPAAATTGFVAGDPAPTMVKVAADRVVRLSRDRDGTWSVQKAVREGPANNEWAAAMCAISGSVSELVGCEHGNHVVRTCYEVLVKPRAAMRGLLLTIGNEARTSRWGVRVSLKDCFKDSDIADVRCVFGVAMHTAVMNDLVSLCDPRAYQYAYRSVMWQLEYLHIIEDEGDYESAVELHTAIMAHGPNIVKGEVGNIVVQHSLVMVEWEIASHAARDNRVWLRLRSDLLSLGLELLQGIEYEDKTRMQCHFIARCIDILWYSRLLGDADLDAHRREYIDCLLRNLNELLRRLSSDTPGRMVIMRGFQLCSSAEQASLRNLCASNAIKSNFRQATGALSKFHGGLLHPDSYSLARLVAPQHQD